MSIKYTTKTNNSGATHKCTGYHYQLFPTEMKTKNITQCYSVNNNKMSLITVKYSNVFY